MTASKAWLAGGLLEKSNATEHATSSSSTATEHATFSSSTATEHATFSSSIATEHATFYASAYGKYSVRTFASYQSSIKFLIWNQVARGIKQQHKATAHIQTIRRIVHTSVHTHYALICISN